MPSLYALFVGIDAYDNGAHLYGCVQDAQRMRACLENLAAQWAYDFKPLSLYAAHGQPNASELRPSRSNILQGFQRHFFQAQEGDFALFFFAGHGSQEPASPYFTGNSGVGKLQTLLACDSRTQGPQGYVRDILDKEIRYLCHRVHARTGVPMIIIQDSCHSEAATRDTKEIVLARILKQLDPNSPWDSAALAQIQDSRDLNVAARYYAEERSPRPLDADNFYLLEEDRARFAAAETQAQNWGQGMAPFEQAFPLSPHLHLAACARDQFAFETKHQDPQTGQSYKGGIFTHQLIKLLQASQGRMSYRQIWERLRMQIEGVFEQTPTLFSLPNQTADKLFLSAASGLKPQAPTYPMVFRADAGRSGAWIASVGALHGLPLIRNNPQTNQPQYLEAQAYRLDQAQERVRAKIAYTMPAHCQVFLEQQLTGDLVVLELEAKHLHQNPWPLFLPEELPQNLEEDPAWPQLQGFWREADADKDENFYEIFIESQGDEVGLIEVRGEAETRLAANQKLGPQGYEGILIQLETLRRLHRWHNYLQLHNPLLRQGELLQDAALSCRRLGENWTFLQQEQTLHWSLRPHEQSLDFSLGRGDGLSLKAVYVSVCALYWNAKISLLGQAPSEQLQPKGQLTYRLNLGPWLQEPFLRAQMRGKSNWILVFLSYRPLDLSFLEQEGYESFRNHQNLTQVEQASLRGQGQGFLAQGHFASDWAVFKIEIRS